MNAVIVLHGLFLLVCYQNQKCSIVAPHTRMTAGGADVHEYKYGTVGTGPGYALTLNSLPAQTNVTTTLMKLGGELAAASTHPFHNSDYPNNTYPTYEFTLNGTQLHYQVDAADVRNVISIPWPNHIRGANRVDVQADDLLNGNSSQLILGPAQGGEYLVSGTTILVFDNGPAFSFYDETGAKIGASSAVATTSAASTSIMVFTSWPPPGSTDTGDHSAGIDGALQGGSGSPTFNFTSIPSSDGFLVGNERAADSLGLPPSVITTPGASSKALSKTANDSNKIILKTGCGSVSIEDAGASPSTASGPGPVTNRR